MMMLLMTSVAHYCERRTARCHDVSETINSIREDVFKATIDAHIPPQSLEEMWISLACRNV
ncbi:hypothetical protein ACLK2H_00655 [Escherichia coli]